jgi:SpoVK/Ycf46/Vps4 family AAA+-type ATPase
VLELQPTVPEEEIGGLDLFKQWMHQRKNTYTDAAIAMNVTPSRGALVIGPPGTGKSMVAKAAGSILSLPVIRFDVGRVFGQYIGQSEQSMRAVLAMLDAMAPCVLMLDEIDKGFSGIQGGGGDSGTTQRVFGTFLTWMQERDQKSRPVFLIMTANRVHGLPPELLRKGRVDEIWSVNVPNVEEREQIVRIHLAKRGQDLDNGDIKAIVRITEGLVGAEIEALIEDALVLSLGNNKPGVTYEFVEQAKSTLKEMAKTRADEFKTMQEWAAQNARSASSAVQSSGGDKPRPARGPRRGGRVRTKVTRK